ncbi:MAG: hypothetical protein V5804_00810 [Mucilaginibacter sp.]|uniref:hypothetical protein n=1 Tax=Mucilaginibacter sp. TaxID=1882438 RepID=UPI0034E57CD3
MKEARGAGYLEFAGRSFSTYYSLLFSSALTHPQRLILTFQKNHYPVFKHFTDPFYFLVVPDEFFPLEKSLAVCAPVNCWYGL